MTFFFQLKEQNKVGKCTALNPSAQCNPTSHTAQSLTFEKSSLGKSRKPNSSPDQGGRENATEREIALWCLFGESIYIPESNLKINCFSKICDWA